MPRASARWSRASRTPGVDRPRAARPPRPRRAGAARRDDRPVWDTGRRLPPVERRVRATRHTPGRWPCCVARRPWPSMRLPGILPGMRPEGAPICRRCLPGTRCAPGTAGRGPDRDAGGHPGAAPPDRVVCPVRRGRPGRPPRAEVQRRTTARRAARSGGGPAVGPRRRGRRPDGGRCRSTPTRARQRGYDQAALIAEVAAADARSAHRSPLSGGARPSRSSTSVARTAPRTSAGAFGLGAGRPGQAA